MQKLIDKIKSNENDENDDDLEINSGRAIFGINIQLDEASVVVDYF
jgi:hypothetical protein